MSSRYRACTVFACIVLSVSIVAADNAAKYKRWKAEDFPNPQKDVGRCGRAVKSSICDPENILTTKQQDIVEGLINQIAEGVSPFKTAQCGPLGDRGFQVSGPELGVICMQGSSALLLIVEHPAGTVCCEVSACLSFTSESSEVNRCIAAAVA